MTAAFGEPIGLQIVYACRFGLMLAGGHEPTCRLLNLNSVYTDPALLLGLVYGRNPPDQVPWVVVCVAAIPFGVVHGMGYAGGEFSFDMVPAIYTWTGGIVYGWLRFSTGSLLFPLLAHSFANVAFHLTALW